MPPPPHHVEMWRNVEGFHTSRTENITLKSPRANPHPSSGSDRF